MQQEKDPDQMRMWRMRQLYNIGLQSVNKDQPSTQQSVVDMGSFRFFMDCKIGIGTYGIVYPGQDLTDPWNKVAVKVLKKGVLGTEFTSTYENRFHTQGKTQIDFMMDNHPASVVRAFHYQKVKIPKWDDQQYYCIAMERMDCNLEDLCKTIHKQKYLIKELQYIVTYLMMLVVKAYQSMYVNGVAHRDLKPNNILIRRGLNDICVKLADFGLSIHHNEKMMKQHAGTKYYRPPQFSQKQEYSNKCDVYSIGAIFIYLLTNQSLADLNIIWQKSQESIEQNIILVLEKRGISKQAIQFIVKCLHNQEKNRLSWEQVFDHPMFYKMMTKGQTIKRKVEVGETYFDCNRYDESIAYFKQALEMEKQLHGSQTPDYSRLSNYLGMALGGKKDYEEQLNCYKQGLRIDKLFGDQESIDYATNLHNMATVYIKMQEFDKALQLLQQCVTIHEKQEVTDENCHAITLATMGNVYKHKQNYQDALQCYKLSLSIQEALDEGDSLQYAITLNDIGDFYSQKKQYKEAKEYFQKSLKITKRIRGITNQRYLVTLIHLVIINKNINMKESQSEQKQLQQILNTIEKRDPIYTASVLDKIAELLQQSKEYEYAIKCLEISSRIYAQQAELNKLQADLADKYSVMRKRNEITVEELKKKLLIDPEKEESKKQKETDKQEQSLFKDKQIMEQKSH